MTTLAQLRAAIRISLPDTTTYPNATLDTWIAFAIHTYTDTFPCLWRHTYSLTTGTQTYDLPANHGFIAPLSLEYPTGQDPQRFLDLVNDERDGRFQNRENVYTIIGIADATAIEANDTPGQIKIAPTVTTGETAILTYHGRHHIPPVGDDDAIITVPPQHHPLIILYTIWQARQLTLANELENPYRNMDIINHLTTAVAKAHDQYTHALTTAVAKSAGKSTLINWLPAQTRIY